MAFHNFWGKEKERTSFSSVWVSFPGKYDCGVWTVIWKGISPSEVVCIRILVCFGDTCLTCINAACWLQGNTGSGIFTKRVIVGACHHMLGRFSSNFSKELLLSRQKVVVGHCEEICVSGGLVCQKLKYYLFFLRQ